MALTWVVTVSEPAGISAPPVTRRFPFGNAHDAAVCFARAVDNGFTAKIAQVRTKNGKVVDEDGSV